jgi:hypothetical protein
MPLFPRRPNALARRCCAADQRDIRHDSCRLYATWKWHFFMLWSNASNGSAATITVLEVQQCVLKMCSSVCPCQKWVLRRPIYTTAHQLWTVHAEGKFLQCLGSLLWRVAVLSCCLQCFLSLDEAVCDSKPLHIATGLAILDHHNPCTPCLPAPNYVGGYQSAGKQDSYSCDCAFLALHNVSSVCLSHHELRMSCCRSTISSPSISSKKMKLQNHVKPPYLEISCESTVACLTSTTCGKLRGSSQSPV